MDIFLIIGLSGLAIGAYGVYEIQKEKKERRVSLEEAWEIGYVAMILIRGIKEPLLLPTETRAAFVTICDAIKQGKPSADIVASGKEAQVNWKDL